MGQMRSYPGGCNGSDDHGDPSPRAPDFRSKHTVAGKDRVWQVPASQDEITTAKGKARKKNMVIVRVE